MVAEVLLIDDDADDAELLQDYLSMEELPIQLEHVLSAREGIDRMCKKLPTLVLLDLNMPGMGGLEALKAIRENPLTSKAKVLVLTTSSFEEDVEGANSAGADAYFTKPHDMEGFRALADVIRRLLSPQA